MIFSFLILYIMNTMINKCFTTNLDKIVNHVFVSSPNLLKPDLFIYRFFNFLLIII